MAREYFVSNSHHPLGEQQANIKQLLVSAMALHSSLSCVNHSSHTLGAVFICEEKQTSAELVGWPGFTVTNVPSASMFTWLQYTLWRQKEEETQNKSNDRFEFQVY